MVRKADPKSPRFEGHAPRSFETPEGFGAGILDDESKILTGKVENVMVGEDAKKHTMDELLDMLNHEEGAALKIKNAAIDEAHVLGDRYAAAAGRSNSLVATNATNSEVATMRSGSSGTKLVSTSDEINRIRDEIADAKLESGGARGQRDMERLVKKMETTLGRDGNKALRDLGSAHIQEQRVLEVLEKQKKAVADKVEKVYSRKFSEAFSRKAEAIGAGNAEAEKAAQKGIEELKAAKDALQSKLVKPIEDKIYAHETRMEFLGQTADDIVEASGGKLKKADFFTKLGETEGKLAGVEAKAAGALEKEAGFMGSKLKLGFNTQTLGALVSVGAIYDGAKRLISGFKGGVNEKGEQTPPDTGQQVMGGLEAGGGAFILHNLLTKGKMLGGIASHL